MNTTDHEVREYLADLRRALVDRPAEERELVVDGVRQHIDDAVAGGASVPQVLEDLGDPLVIAASAGGPERVAGPPAPFLERRSGVLLTVLLLVLGGFVVPVVGWVVGVGLLWSSRAWTFTEKVVGTVAPLLAGAVLTAVGALLDVLTSGAVALTHLGLLGGLTGGAIASGVFLWFRARTAPR